MEAAVLGGIIIGISASVMLLFIGRITGISGIIGEVLKFKSSDKGWRLSFLSGLLLGGVLLKIVYPSAFEVLSAATAYDYILAGLFVGLGTTMGSGCTSGHGVCGISRLSMRSISATIIFIFSGMLSLYAFKIFRGGI